MNPNPINTVLTIASVANPSYRSIYQDFCLRLDAARAFDVLPWSDALRVAVLIAVDIAAADDPRQHLRERAAAAGGEGWTDPERAALALAISAEAW
jgi:hypothetical protein